jgi:hypothetical protein
VPLVRWQRGDDPPGSPAVAPVARRGESKEEQVNQHHHGPLAGLGAGAAAVLFAFGVMALAWHRVAGPVSLAITVLAVTVMLAAVLILAAAAVYVFLWVRHRARNPELLARRPSASAVTGPQAVEPAVQPAAIGPPSRAYYVTRDELAAVRRHDTEEPS